MAFVHIIQYVHPNGRERDHRIELPDEYADAAKDLVLSCECMPNDYSKVVFYAHRRGEDPEETGETTEIGDNGPGENSPVETLKRLIDKMRKEKEHGTVGNRRKNP